MQPNDNRTMGGVMLRILRNSVFGLGFLSTLLGAAPHASAAYPDRPVHWIIGFSAGGPVDIVARIMANWLSDRFGQKIIGEKKARSRGHNSARGPRALC